MTPQQIPILAPHPSLPTQRPSTSIDPHEQSVRRLTDLVLGAAALADRLERASAGSPLDAACAARVARLRAFVSWACAAIDRAVTDDAYARLVCGEPAATP